MPIHDIKREISKDASNPDLWHEISTDGMDPERTKHIEDLEWAIRSHLGGNLTKENLVKRGLHYQQVIRAVNRCTSRWHDGTLVGWRGLIFNLRVRGYNRQSADHDDAGKAGIFAKFLRDHSDIREELDHFLLTGIPGDKFSFGSVTPKMAHQHFIALCDKKNLPQGCWPYNTIYRGRSTITKYVKMFYAENYDEIVYREYGDKAKCKANTGRGFDSRIVANLPYDIWEVDEHKMHVICAIGINTPKGRRYVEIRRITLIAVVDRATGNLMGYSIIFRREANARDILNAIEHALGPWEPMEFSREGRRYSDGAGFPSGLVDSARRCAPAVIFFDNALAHLAEEITERLRNRLGCSVSYGPVKRFERRAAVEGTFSDVVRSIFMHLASTTGTGPQDPRRKEPGEAAKKLKTEIDDIVEYIEIALSSQNVRQGSRNFGISPMAELMRVMSSGDIGFIPPRLPEPLVTEAPLSALILDLPICGSKSKGVRPHVNFERAPYTNPDLAERWDLIGKTLRIHANTLNVNTLKAFDPSGALVGELHARGQWGKFAHSLEIRKLMLAKIANNEISARQEDDPTYILLTSQEREISEKLDEAGASTTDDASKVAATQSSARNNNESKAGFAKSPRRADRTASNGVDELELDFPETILAIN